MNYINYFSGNQIGGGNCSLCGSPGTNKSSCPCNPQANGGNPKKHPLAKNKCPALSGQLKKIEVKAVKAAKQPQQKVLVKPLKPVEEVPEIPVIKEQVVVKDEKKPVLKEITIIEAPPQGCAYGKIGRRRTMEDAHVTASLGEGINLFGVFDGHGGDGVADLLVTELPKELSKALTGVDLLNEQQVKEAIKRAYLTIDEGIFDSGERSGSTAVVVLQILDKLYFINLGDSRAVLIQNYAPIHATKDHKPDDPAEKVRIEAAGGYVQCRGVPRVCGSLAVSRAFGDNQFKHDDEGNYAGENSKVSPVPDVTTYMMKPGEQYIALLACDGLWDVMSNAQAASDIPSTGSLSGICESLIDEAISIGSRDNVSVMLVPLST